ncbi:MAG: GWxTD domain-containing protein [Gemmatimonadetes bacterium]|nr:GWxTD domain-containing protein [Gemmatimonadota bacterium]
MPPLLQWSRRAALAPALFVLVCTVAARGAAQMAPAPSLQGAAAGTVAADADAAATAGDTARAVALLEGRVKVAPTDAPAWHYLGLLRWHLAGTGARIGIERNVKKMRLLSGADTALRLATQYAPDSTRYWLALVRFNLRGAYATVRVSARGQAENAMEAAERSNDRVNFAAAADARGASDWRRFEVVGNRAIGVSGMKVQVGPNANWQRQHARDYVETIARKIKPPTGDADFASARRYFEKAVAADSTNLTYARHLYMTYAAEKAWEPLAALAERRARQFPLDAQSRLVLGLAYHRLQREGDAQRAFDSAFALMDDTERARITRFTRVMRPRVRDRSLTSTDSVAFGKLPPAQQRGLEEMFWLMSDPLTLTAENEYRLEFWSRVVYADLRWSDEEMGYYGADSDRGEIYVRFGPPDEELTVSGNTNVTGVPVDNGATLVWAYDGGTVFFFDLSPAFGTARMAQGDRDYVERLIEAQPATFANIPATRLIDTIPVRVTRFRVGADSTDAVIAAALPLDSLLRGVELDRVPVDIDLRIFDQFVRVQGVESDQAAFARDSARGAMLRTWTRRLGPGINVVRVEAMQGDSRRAARAMSRLTPVAGTGFGMSDVLLGGRPTVREGATPRRWRDVAITANDGTFARGSAVGLLWELYEPTARDGRVNYHVEIAVERNERGGPLGAGIRLLDALGRAVGRAQASRDKFTIAFDRTAAATPVVVEYLTLEMADAPAGTYRLRVTLTDRATGTKTQRDTEFRLR